MGGGYFDMVEQVSLLFKTLNHNLYDNIIYRNIFPNEPFTKNKRLDNKNVELDPASIRSKAKRARLARAEERRRQAAVE